MHKIVRRIDIRRLIFEPLRNESLVPLVAASNEAQCNRIGNGVEWNPNTDVVHAVNSVIRIVVVPWGDFFGFGFFDQNVFVEEATSRCVHQTESGHRDRAVYANFGEFWEAVPVHVVVKESTRCTSGGVFVCPRTRVCHIGCNTLAK